MIQIHIYVEHSTDVPLKVRRIWTFHFNIWIQHQYLFISKNAKWFVFSTIFVFVLYDLFLCKLCSINHYDQGVRIESVFWSLIDIKHMANLYVYMLIDTCTCQINITVGSEFSPHLHFNVAFEMCTQHHNEENPILALQQEEFCFKLFSIGLQVKWWHVVLDLHV